VKLLDPAKALFVGWGVVRRKTWVRGEILLSAM